jgi:hypothetical protein
MIINGECTVSIDGKEYWTVRQFSKLTNRKESSIRFLTTGGNRIRKLNYLSLNSRLFIPLEELFEFPFTVKGRTSKDLEVYVIKFKIKDGELTTVEKLVPVNEVIQGEENIEKCQ